MLPGGYTFIHMIFWSLVAMIVVGIHAIIIFLVTGAGVLVSETLGKGGGED